MTKAVTLPSLSFTKRKVRSESSSKNAVSDSGISAIFARARLFPADHQRTHLYCESVLEAIFACVRAQDCRIEFDWRANPRRERRDVKTGDAFCDVSGAGAGAVAEALRR